MAWLQEPAFNAASRFSIAAHRGDRAGIRNALDRGDPASTPEDRGLSIRHVRRWADRVVREALEAGLDLANGLGLVDRRDLDLAGLAPDRAEQRRLLKLDARNAHRRARAAEASSNIPRPKKAR